jgi:RHS repeat-associated protein
MAPGVRDRFGRITRKTEVISGTTTVYDYTYDSVGRLDTVAINEGLAADYAYDANGNRTAAPNLVGAAIYDAQDRLTWYGATQCTYSPSGELTSKGATTYEYDALGHLRNVDAGAIAYAVDGQQRRVGRRVGGALSAGYLYEGQLRVVAELDGAGELVSRFVHGTRANVPELIVRAGATYRIVADHLGTPRLVVNVADGTLAQRIDCDEFGNVVSDTNPGFQPFGFAGGMYDLATGLVRFGARDYDPQVGRWTAKDGVGFGGGTPNLYEYVTSDPVNSYDPEGSAQRGKRNIGTGGYTKKSPLPEVEAAAKKAAEAGKTKFAKALRSLAKVIKRGGAAGLILGELGFPEELNAGEPDPSAPPEWPDSPGGEGEGDGDGEGPEGDSEGDGGGDGDGGFSPLNPECPRIGDP